MKIALIVDRTQCYTGTVASHINALLTHSEHEVHSVDYRAVLSSEFELDDFNALVHHYSLRICFPYYSQQLLDRESGFRGLKFLFIQDEYDSVNVASKVINYVGYNLVFSCVPPQHIPWVYAGVDRSVTDFTHVLTGYASDAPLNEFAAASNEERPYNVSYRGRDIGIRYGQLGRQKVEFPQKVLSRCSTLGLSHSIAWTEHERLYGADWQSLLRQSSVVLGTPSGSNVFDFDGKLAKRVSTLRSGGCADEMIYEQLVAPLERPGVMNQISPRVFEALEQGCALCLLEDDYSGLLRPNEHYFAVRADYSNLDEILELLRDPREVKAKQQCAFDDLIRSRLFTYSSMAQGFDQAISHVSKNLWPSLVSANHSESSPHLRNVGRRHIRRLRFAFIWQPPLIDSRLRVLGSLSRQRGKGLAWRFKHAIRVRLSRAKSLAWRFKHAIRVRLSRTKA